MSDRRSVHQPLSLILLILATALMATFGASGCREHRDRSGLLKAVPTTDIRFTAVKTGVGDFSITLPQPFVIDAEAGAQSDVFFFTDLSDTGEVQKGMIYLTIALKPLVFIPDTADVSITGGNIGGEDLDWKESRDIAINGALLYQREAIAQKLLTMNPSPGTTGSFIMQAFVVGTDSVLVERLMAAVETIKSVPKANL